MSLSSRNVVTLSCSVGLLALACSTGALSQGSQPAGGGSTAAGGTGSAAAIGSTDRTFVQKAAMGGMAEVAAGQLAQQKASAEPVKTYGAHLVDDHTKANDELKQIAGGKGVDVPAAPDAAHQKAMAKMQTLSGSQFDRAFKAQMVADHKDTIALFKRESASGKDADLKAFAAKTLPDLQDHLKMAQALK